MRDCSQSQRTQRTQTQTYLMRLREGCMYICSENGLPFIPPRTARHGVSNSAFHAMSGTICILISVYKVTYLWFIITAFFHYFIAFA